MRGLTLLAAATILAGTWSLAARSPVSSAQGSSKTQDAQDEVSEETLAKIEKYLGLAKTGRAAVRPQAARRLSQLGAPALARIKQLAGDDGAGLVELGPHIVEVLGDFEDAALRTQLWRALADPDFPWRGPAARSLAKTAQERELASFMGLFVDHLWQVRHASLDAARRIDARAHAHEVRKLLEDQDGGVRRAAATLLDEWGEHGALHFLVEDLRREDQYFRMPLGAQARFDALRVLKERLGDDFGFDPSKSPTVEANVTAIAKLEAAARKRADGDWPELPDIARAASVTEGDVIGLELRSCRAGEFYLRWNESDLLYVGTGNAALVTLTEGTVKRLRDGIERRLAELGDTRYWGESGCDLEQFRLLDGAGELQVYLLSKGQANAGDLRPEALDAVAQLLLATLPDAESPDPRLTRLRSRARAALVVLGGEL